MNQDRMFVIDDVHDLDKTRWQSSNATGCNPVDVGAIPTLVSRHEEFKLNSDCTNISIELPDKTNVVIWKDDGIWKVYRVDENGSKVEHPKRKLLRQLLKDLYNERYYNFYMSNKSPGL